MTVFLTELKHVGLPADIDKTLPTTFHYRNLHVQLQITGKLAHKTVGKLQYKNFESFSISLRSSGTLRGIGW